MNDKPILFSAPMVRAQIEGRKTQTRRVIDPQPKIDSMGNWCQNGWNFGQSIPGPSYKNFANCRCPYGKPGGRLWVREGWHTEFRYNDVRPNQLRDDAKIWYDFYPVPSGVTAIKSTTFCGLDLDAQWSKGRRRPSIHLPRRFSRITNVLTEVRVQRLQDISEDDAIAEGVEPCEFGYKNYDPAVPCDSWQCPRESFRTLWDSINGKTHPWKSNPWVWALTYTVHLCNIDHFPDATKMVRAGAA